MAIPTSGSVSTEVPAGLQTEFRIAKATFDPDGRFGPQVELDIEMVDEKFVGTQLRYWASVQRPRLDLVRKYRGDGMSDKLIAEALRERGHKCKKIDDEDTMTVGRGGNLYKLLVATTGSIHGAETALQECDSFDELAQRLVGSTFVGTTKKSVDGKYVQLDGQEEIFPVASAPAPKEDASPEPDPEEDFENIPF
jgi:hypothetical protein